MANALSMFEEMITTHGPVQESIIRNLTAWELRNLQLAGIGILASQEVQRKYQIPNRCSEKDPDNQEGMCTNTTESFDEIRACVGHPSNLPIPKPLQVLQNWLGDHKTKPCLENLEVEFWRSLERLRHPPGSVPEREANTDERPIHNKVCRRCRDFYAAENLNEQLTTIESFRWPLCKYHGLKMATEFPLNACRCLAFVNEQWRCKRCTNYTLAFLNMRAFKAQCSLRRLTFPWSRPWKCLRMLWDLPWPYCPIEGCLEPACFDETSEGMQLCLGCNTICCT